MSPYKAFLNNVRQYFNTNGFLRFLLSGYIFIFALGGLLYLLSAYIMVISEPFIAISGILMYAGLILTLLREDMLTIVITSGVISIGSLVAWILGLARGYGFSRFLVTPFLYFIMFGLVTVFVLIKSEKFREMRAASAAARQMAGIACPRCGAFVPANAAFCPSCGVQNPAAQQYGPVQQAAAMPQYAPPQPQYAPPVPPQYSPVPPQAAPVPPQAPPVTPEAAPEKAASADAELKCSSCGADIPQGAAFCAKCGAKQ